ncbi:MAG: DUF424 family protein [Methanomassiliicoccales archaeon]|nr:DUF424 family protein [Methanomassiliicoccales archaeon]
MKMIRVKVHKRGGDILVAACDEGLLGQMLKDGDLRLDVSEEFYGGDSGGEEMLLNRLAVATLANLVGKDVCRIAAEHDYIDQECVITIEGVPHAQMVRY